MMMEIKLTEKPDAVKPVDVTAKQKLVIAAKPPARKLPAKRPAPKAPPKPTIAALHDLLAHFRIVLVDPFGQRWAYGDPDAKTEVVISNFPECIPGRFDEWQEPERPLVIGDKEYSYTRR